MSDFLMYWRPETADNALAGEDLLLNHSASGQYDRLTPGDTLWIATAWPGGILTLIGRLVVGVVTDQATASKLLGTDDLWDAPYHVVAAEGTAEPMREVDLTDLATQLRFVSAHDRLTVIDGRVNANQLQAMRQLTADSARLMESRWREDTAIATSGDAALEETHSLAGFGDPVSNAQVESAAIRHVTARLKEQGWSVASVESLRIGYDLRCTRGRDELHAEVKGTRAVLPSFIITEGELRRADADLAFRLFVVTDALGTAPVMHEFDADSIFESFDFTPLAHRAVPRRRDSSDAGGREPPPNSASR
jgi:hypothetical protein